MPALLTILAISICTAARAKAGDSGDPFPRYEWATDDECWSLALHYRADILRYAKERGQLPDASIHERKMQMEYQNCIFKKAAPKPEDICKRRAVEARAWAGKIQDANERTVRLAAILREEKNCVGETVIKTEAGCPVESVSMENAFPGIDIFREVDETRKPTVAETRLLCGTDLDRQAISRLAASILGCVAKDLAMDPEHAPCEVTFKVPLSFRVVRVISKTRLIDSHDLVKGTFSPPSIDEALSSCVNHAVEDESNSFGDSSSAMESGRGKPELIVHVTTPPATAFIEKRAAQGELESANRLATECSQKIQSLQEAKMQAPECQAASAQARTLASYCADVGRLKELDAEIRHMQRVDAASGTRNLAHRRNLAAAKLFLEDRVAGIRKVLASAGKSPSESDCKTEGAVRTKQRVSAKCTPKLTVKAFPECTWLCWSFPSACTAPFHADLTAPDYVVPGQPTSHLLSSAAAQLQRLPGVRVVANADIPAGAVGLARICVGDDGLVSSVQVLQAPTEVLGSYIKEDVPHWRFKPLLVEDKPVPFYFFGRIEPRSAKGVATCDSKDRGVFEAALQEFCADKKSIIVDPLVGNLCYPTIGKCGKNSPEHHAVQIPADREDFENTFEGPRRKGVSSSSVVARFHWQDRWIVTDLDLGQVEFEGVE